MQELTAGTVYLVGAGPGDPGLLTLRGAELLGEAGAVVYDALVNPVLLDRAAPGAERFDVGRRAGHRLMEQRDVDRLLVRLARRHRVVVRLKGGDPFVFGRGGEEALALRTAGVPFQVVPGVTSALGAAAYAGIPLTHRGVSSSVTFRTGHRSASCGAPGDPIVGRIGGGPDPSGEGTVVVFMGLGRVAEIASELIRGGRSPATPAAVVERCTLPDQRTVIGTLADIGARVRRADLRGPALIVVGDVVALRSRIGWLREDADAPRDRSPVGAVR